MAGGDQRRAAVAVGAGEIGAGRQCEAHDFGVTVRAGQQKRAVVNGVLRVDVGAALDQQSRGFDMAALGGGEHRVAAACVTSVDRRSRVK